MFNKVLYAVFDRYPFFKGSTTHIKYFMEYLKKGGYDVTLAADTFIEGESFYGIKMKERNIFKRAFKFSDEVFDFLVRKGFFNIFHFRDPFCGFEVLNFRDKLGISTLYEVNGFPSIEWRERYKGIKKSGISVLREMEKYSILNCDVIITPSEITRRYIFKRFKRSEGVFVIPNGVDIDYFYPRDVEIENYLLFCGSVRPWQGLFEFVKTFGKAISKRGFYLKVVGDIKKRDEKVLLKLCSDVDLECDITGVLPYELIPEIISRAKLCVLPLKRSKRNVTQGACPLKLFEYVACKRPVFSTDLEIVREHFSEDEIFFFSEFDLKSGEDVLDMALFDEDEIKKRVERGYEKVLKKYLWQFSGEKLIEVYRKYFPF